MKRAAGHPVRALFLELHVVLDYPDDVCLSFEIVDEYLGVTHLSEDDFEYLAAAKLKLRVLVIVWMRYRSAPPILSTRPTLHQHRPGLGEPTGSGRRGGGRQVNLRLHAAGRRCRDRERFAPCSSSQVKPRQEIYQLRQLPRQSFARSRSTQIGHSVQRRLSAVPC